MSANATTKTGRRGFFKEATALALGAVAGLVPAVVALTVFFDPLRRKSGGGNGGSLVRVASLNAVPNDGLPHKFSIVADRTDAWNKFPNVPVGGVYLRRTGEKTVEAFNAICPHAGGFIDYTPSKNCFTCPLHDSQFALDGSVNDPKSPSPRAMDSLTVEIRGDEIWVNFQNFRAGIREKIVA